MSTQEVKVKVVVRARPLLPKEKLAGEQSCLKIDSPNRIVVGRKESYNFDRVFLPRATQQEVYDYTVKPLLIKCLEGYNVTVFSYGPTGSGKTYTIGGYSSTQGEDERGLIPRVAEDIFIKINEIKGRKISIKISYLEIYKEELRDLLDSSMVKDILIQEDDKGSTIIKNNKEVSCKSAAEMVNLLEEGERNRQIGATSLNEMSSRSHAIYIATLTQTWSNQILNDGDESRMEHTLESKFHFVDLAGSEGPRKMELSAEKMKESIFINSGLSRLSKVITALTDKNSSHVPYRDSKITRILKDSLGGKAQTVMICCINSSSKNMDESLKALNYAARAAKIKNKPVINKDARTVKIEEMESEIKLLKEKLFKQQTSFTEASSVDDQYVSKLERDVSNLRDICKKAYQAITTFSNDPSFDNSSIKLAQEWLESYEEVKCKDFDDPMVHDLKAEINRLEKIVRTDEKLFANKVSEFDELNERIKLLEVENMKLLKEKENISSQLHEQVLSKHPVDLVEFLDKNASQSQAFYRAQSVPAQRLAQAGGNRRVNTSPNLHTTRIFEGFCVRSQILLSRVEDEDDVRQPEFDEDDNNPQTPISSNFERHGRSRSTFKVTKPKNIRNVASKIPTAMKRGSGDNEAEKEINKIKMSYAERKRRINVSDKEVTTSTKLLKDIATAIDLKKDLIKFMKGAQEVSRSRRDFVEMKLEALVEERDQLIFDTKLYEKEFKELNLEEQASKQSSKKNDILDKIKGLTKKRQDFDDALKIAINRKNKMETLESTVLKMTSEQHNLKQHVQNEREIRRKIMDELMADEKRLKELEKKVGKTIEDPLARNGRVLEKMHWLDFCAREVVAQKKREDDLLAEIIDRDNMIAKRESLLTEKGELELKKMRHKAIDQVVLINVVLFLLNGLHIDDAISAIDSTLAYKDEMIENHKVKINKWKSNWSEKTLQSRLGDLNMEESKYLLRYYFERVIFLLQKLDWLHNNNEHMSIKIEELEEGKILKEGQLQALIIETEKKLTKIQKDYEIEISVLKRQMNSELEKAMKYEEKLKNVMGDLYYYKQLSRQYRKKYGEVKLTDSLGEEQKSVRVSKKNVRQLNDAEIKLRRSSANSIDDV
ncbi:DgyrCDS13631 [Dimorphilus gyrociliatus]|uniref:DgyrCDS13631 n=1 Tax=Dimorphilus gyrociliatus TaxID=2664684 RepID=A0A7I8WB87_9ANNE|nr:DgyrCDS13631 [Dimorphilus gyrociliatus]